MADARSPYVLEYEGRFDFAVPPQEVWSAVEHLEHFETWWGWLGEFRVEGDGLTAGSVLHGVVAPPLPYRMRLRVVLVECDPPHRIDAAVAGDLEGRARIVLEPEGAGTRARVAWEIEMMQRPMRVACRMAFPVLRWGHDRVVDATVAGFRRHLRTRAS
ncbi:MAG: SRPBCC family protein [Acidimicrobiia bacterium]